MITDPDLSVIPFIPPQEFNAPFLDFIKQVPKDILQLDSGLGYHELALRNDLDNPTRFHVIYPHNLNTLLKSRGRDQITLFLVDMKTQALSQVIDDLTHFNSPLHYYLPFNIDKGEIPGLPNVIQSPGEFLHSLVLNQEQIFELLGIKTKPIMPQTPLFDKDALGFPPFVPAQTTYFIANQLLGNFSYDDDSAHIARNDEESLIEHSKGSLMNADTFERQQLIIREVEKIDSITLTGEDEKIVKKLHPTNTLLSPLVVLAPFQNPDLKHFGKAKKDNKEDLLFVAFQKALNFEQTRNYTNNLKFSEDLKEHRELVPLIGQLTTMKSRYMDFVGFLHSSFRNSPLIRLPFQGRSLYKELSVFRTDAMHLITQPANGKNINKTIARFGQALASRTISPELKIGLKALNRQIVSMSDMPFEWLDLDGIPLAFSHDVCRMPETPIHGLMATFARNEQFAYTVPEDILSKTLVIFGSEENAFRIWQPLVIAMGVEMGFQCKVCLNASQAVMAIKENKPDFIIFDCHGGFDERTNSSYLMLGKEKLTGDLIVQHQLSAPLIFLSACNTAPTYGTIHPVANAFFEAGCLSVTSTYLPINIKTSTILYIRLLRNLRMAATIALHHNWLGFVAHTVRTSAIAEAFNFVRSTKKTEAEQQEIDAIQARTHTLLMSFHHRRQIYEELEHNLKKLSGKDQHIMSKLVPEYLFYTNLGRSDLVKFEVFTRNLKALNAFD
ncbi:CHAT domain-containing protein [Mucilaginibacter sp. 44-25]|uniref:CHAT domain-containing protein n=1 Tax=Mucilaginibacter sp. 44-25 TaxID=1895794 RepID=UPI0025ED8A7F|nr:CHAT domain-containing protein [Mucilaginibacter sp. 44-25]